MNIKHSRALKSPTSLRSFRCKTHTVAGLLPLLLLSGNAFATPAVWVTPIAGGEMRFYDWGYVGPGGRTANDFSSIGGFNGPSQIQHVVTTDPDHLTPDSSNNINVDLTDTSTFTNANMDGQVNFYRWGYTTVGGSVFSNMQIDSDGDYLVKRSDMHFAFYDTFDYVDDTGVNPPEVFDTNIDFQPYALSDAHGWCGSVTASNPNALEAMAGQVSFDFGFEAFLPWSPPGNVPGTGSMQIVQNFQMRSYGSLEIDVSTANGGSGDFLFQADAVVNNTNPQGDTTGGDPTLIEVPVLNMDGTPALDGNGDPRTMMVPQNEVGGSGADPDYYNKVSFMGGGIVPAGAWVRLADPSAPITDDNILEVLDADDGGANTVWHVNSFAGYPFLLRADGIRVLDAMDYSLYSDLSGVPQFAFDENGNMINVEGQIIGDLSAVPVPAAVWLFGSGMLGLLGFARRRKA